MASKDDRLNTEVRKYNDDSLEALNNAITGSFKVPKMTLADIAGLAVGNDNDEEEIVRHG